MSAALSKAIDVAITSTATNIHNTNIRILVGKREGRKFGRQIEPMHFFAAFQALASRASGVGGHDSYSYAIFPQPVSPFTRLVYETTQERWEHTTALMKPFMVRPFSDGGWHFDVMLTAEQRETVQVPNAVREARAIAQRTGQTMKNARTSLSMPEVMHKISKRWLRFAQFPSWTMWFEVGDVTGITETNGIEGPERVFHVEGQSFEITLECIDAAANNDAIGLLHLLANCLGDTEIAVERKFAADKQEYELETCI